MKRILMMVIRNIFLVPPMWIKLVYYSTLVDKYTDEEHNNMLKYIVYRANKGGNVHIDAYGVENIPEKNGFMFFPNHQGMYDALAIMDACPVPFSVVAKKEVKDVPFLKQVFACLKAYMLDRNDVKQAMKVIIDVSNGSFKAATKAKCPIVPVALIDSFKPFDTNSIRKVNVQVHFLKPLYYEDYKDMKTTEIAEMVRQRIQDTIDKNQ